MCAWSIRKAAKHKRCKASVQGWIAHVNFGDTWGLRGHIFNTHPIKPFRTS